MQLDLGDLKKTLAVRQAGENSGNNPNHLLYSIFRPEGTRPIQQPPHKLGPQKEHETDNQMQDLLERSMIEPANWA